MAASPRATRILLPLLALLTAMATPSRAATDAPLLRTPDIHEDLVVFAHGADLWTVPAAGGQATRLTIHDGDEQAPSFSPDGSLIAFTAEYDGNGDVYVMDRHGGNITRVTFHPGFDQVVGWHPAQNKIMFRAARTTLSRANRPWRHQQSGRDDRRGPGLVTAQV